MEGFAGKWLELLQETVPKLNTVAVIFNPQSPLCVRQVRDLEANVGLRRLKLKPIEVRTRDGLAHSFEQAQRQAQAVIVLTDPLTFGHQREIAILAAKHRLPSIFSNVEFVDAGGLMAYGVELAAIFPRVAEYVDTILRGSNPAELPIEQPREIAFVINLKTAKSLGLEIPHSVLLLASEVIR